MPCSFCHSDKPRPHNVRTCPQLDKAIVVYCGKTLAQWSQESLTDELVAAGIDICLTGGIATAASMLYDGYQYIQRAGFASKFASASRLQKSEIIKKFIEGDDIDALLGQL